MLCVKSCEHYNASRAKECIQNTDHKAMKINYKFASLDVAN